MKDNITIEGEIEELKHQDYHGRSIKVNIEDQNGSIITSKIDIGVHKHFEIEQDNYCFDVCLNDNGASLLKNTAEQSFAEKLRSLLIFGPNSTRYKDIFDMYYLKDILEIDKIRATIKLLIFDDTSIRENDYSSIIKRLERTFNDEIYISRISNSKQRWLDESIEKITTELVSFIKELI